MTNDNVHLELVEASLPQVSLVLLRLGSPLHPLLALGRWVYYADEGLSTAESVVLSDVVVGEEVKIDPLHGSADSLEPVLVAAVGGGEELVELVDDF